MVIDGRSATETYADYLPRGSCLAVGKESGGFDAQMFLEWAKVFAKRLRDLTSNGRKVLIIYDSYATYMRIRVLEMFRANNILVYALPAHTSGKTQPLDDFAFAFFKRSLIDAIAKVQRANVLEELDMYAYCTLLTVAYYVTFTRENVKASFRMTGIWPLDQAQLMNKALPLDENSVETVVSVADMMHMYDTSRAVARNSKL